MKFSELGKRALFYVSVPKCVCCEEILSYQDLALCPKCSAEFEKIKTRDCSICGKRLHLCSCSTDYLKSHFMKRLVKVFRYIQREENLPANSLIYSLKRDDRRDVLNLCANELAEAIRASVSNPKKYIITNVPRRKSAIIQYGIDHSAELAKAVAKRLGAEYHSLLVSHSRRPQKKTHGDERLHNVNFDVKREVDLSGRYVIIVDDVITTGASMGAASVLVRSMGAKQIFGAALSIAYKDGIKK